MKKLFAIALVVGLGATAVAHARPLSDMVVVDDGRPVSEKLKLVEGRPYDAARSALRGSGAKPVKLTHDNASIVCDDDFCRQYPEVIDCDENRLGDCTMAYIDTATQTYLIVRTYGESDLTVEDVRVADESDVAQIQQRKASS